MRAFSLFVPFWRFRRGFAASFFSRVGACAVPASTPKGPHAPPDLLIQRPPNGRRVVVRGGNEDDTLLNEAIGDLLPSALAVALSPIPIVAVVLVLGASHARTAGPAFAFGWIAGLLAVSLIVVLVLEGGSDPDSDDPGINWLKVAIGVLFLLMAANQWKKNDRRTTRNPRRRTGWQALTLRHRRERR
jgi:hypothetical protein